MNQILSDELSIELLQIKKASLIFRAINHRLRQQMIKLLHEHKKMTVTEIYMKLELEQSVASQHLAILRKAGFVLTKRDGKFVYYSVNYEMLQKVHKNGMALLQVREQEMQTA